MKLAIAIDLALQLLTRSVEISQIITRANSEGRDTLTEDETDLIEANADRAHDHLVEAIEKAAREGR